MPLIGVDLGGTKTEVAVLGQGNRFLFRKRAPTPSHSYQLTLETIVKLVDEAKRECGLPSGQAVGMGIPGCIDPQTQTVRGANSQALNGKLLQKDLSSLLGCSLVVENDANCLVVSEATDGAAAGARLTFGVILGTGCGGGLALGSSVWAGLNALAGEWGHNPLPWPSKEELDIPTCWCGQTGCLESWLSGPALLQDHLRRGGLLSSTQEIVNASRNGETEAVQTLSRYKARLARALAQVVNLVDPEVIVLGGGLSQIPEIYQGLCELIQAFTFHSPIQTRVLPAMHGDSSGVRGAAWLASCTASGQ